MTDLNPDEEHFYATSSTTVLNDLLADTATRLGGKLVALSRAATTDTERQRWRQRMYEVEDQKEAIDPDDRDTLVAHIRTWRSEITRLRNQQA